MAEEPLNGDLAQDSVPAEVIEEAALAVVALQEILSCFVELIVMGTSASEGSLMLLHEGREVLTITSASGLGREIVQGTRRHLGEGISGWVAKHKEPLLLVGPIKDARFSGVDRGIKDALCVPLMTSNDVIGVLSVSNKKGAGSFSEEDLERLVELARPAARMILLTLAQREADAESRAWERKQLAQEIHDGPMQELSSVILLMELYKRVRRDDVERAEKELSRAKEQALDCLQELRHFAYDLRLTDLEKLSLLDELRRYTVEFQKRTGISVSLGVDGMRREIPVSVKKNLYRIAQEALTNVRRHARASQVEIRLHCTEDQLVMNVEDNGRGFVLQEALERAQSEKRFGLLGMQERAYLMGGTLETETAPGEGTTLRVILPL
ncbi:MAG TPA: GAF domain-containing sensor histidine kinase [Anaerolineae bacterium]|nr:GAF domain-containing sensor histidine kinase [Anaerolineae bacterium]